jgi:hypothetical protein
MVLCLQVIVKKGSIFCAKYIRNSILLLTDEILSFDHPLQHYPSVWYSHHMKTKLIFILSLTFLFLYPSISFSQTSLSHPSFSNISIGQPKSPIPIISSKFYVGIRNSKDEELVWTESNFVQLTPDNSCYSWEIELDTELISIPTKEILILPNTPKFWSSNEGEQTLHHDNKISVLEGNIKVEDRIIASTWCVAGGDPVGNYKLQVYIKGVLLETFSFVVGFKL